MREGAKGKGEVSSSTNPPGHRQLSDCPQQATGTEQEDPDKEPVDIRSRSDSPPELLLWGLTPGESGDLLRPGCRQWQWGTQAGCFPASHGLCWGHTRGDTHTQTSATHRPGPAFASEHKWALRPRLVVRDLGPSSPSQGTLAAPLKKPQLPPPRLPAGSTENKVGQHWGQADSVGQGVT